MANTESKTAAPKKAGVRVKKKVARNVPSGIIYIRATFNNTIVTVTDLLGHTIAWASAGKANFAGSRKSTPFAAQVAAANATKDAMAVGMRECEVRVKGPGAGRDAAVRSIMLTPGMTVSAIRDITPVPHNGCRARKRRRV